jgi:hypothetical protein
MFANRHFGLSALLAASLGVGIAATAAGCGSSPHNTAPATTSAAPSATAAHSGSSASAQLGGIVSCLNARGMALPGGVKAAQIRAAYEALPPAQQLSDFKACENLLPAELRQKIQALINEREAAPTATP